MFGLNRGVFCLLLLPLATANGMFTNTFSPDTLANCTGMLATSTGTIANTTSTGEFANTVTLATSTRVLATVQVC